MLVGPPSGYPGPAFPWFPYRLEGSPVKGGSMEWVGHAGTKVSAFAMADWLVNHAKLYAAVEVLESHVFIEAQP